MSTFDKILDKALSVINEDASLKDPTSGGYDRQYAEDMLYHTLGPLTNNPRWANKPWSGSGPEPEGFQPGGPAYQWTPEEIVFAIAGNPSKMFQGGADSPGHGRYGGAPLFRMARQVARKFGKGNDRDFIADLYSNGFVPLTRMMKPGYDEGRSGFISYVMRTVKGAMEAGPGAERSSLDATADDRAVGKLGLRAALKSTNPQEIRAAANTVKGKYQTERSFDRHPDNPFEQYSSSYYQTMMAYADALESGNEDQIEAARSRIQQLVDTITDANPQIRGAASGLGQAISNKDRKTSIGIASMDNASDDEASTLGSTMSSDEHEDSWLDPEAVEFVLGIALKYDLQPILSKNSKWIKMAAELGAKGGKLGGIMTVNELRYVIRSLGPLGSNYPGRDVVRKNVQIPRDSPKWWAPGEDPEIEPLPNGGQWTSIWKRGGFPAMQATAIANEMTQEVDEFNKLGIKTKREVKDKGKIREVVSKVAVSNTVKAATIKLRIIADIHKDQLGLGEDINDNIPRGLFTDAIDRQIIIEHAERIATILENSLRSEIIVSEDAAKKKSGKVKQFFHQLSKPARPKNGKSNVTSNLKYQDKLSKWSSKLNENTGSSCPKCQSPIVMTERRRNGNSTCENGHVFPSPKS